MKLKTHKSSSKDRPLRVYKNIKKRKKYIRKTRNGKKLYIKTKGNMTNSNIVKVVVHNSVARHPTTKTPSSKKRSAFTQKLDKSHTPIANTPYHQAPQVVVMPPKASSINDNDNKHAGEIARLRRDYTQLESKLKETTPAVTVEPVKTKTTEEASKDNGEEEEEKDEHPPPPQTVHHHFDDEGDIIDELPDALPMNQRKTAFNQLKFQQLIRIARGKGIKHD